MEQHYITIKYSLQATFFPSRLIKWLHLPLTLNQGYCGLQSMSNSTEEEELSKISWKLNFYEHSLESFKLTVYNSRKVL